MHKLTVTLKQHTPLIHFQHDQEGATLRASEVKPKLDKFLMENYFDSDSFDSFKNCLNGYSIENESKLLELYHQGKYSFNYKIKILVKSDEKIAVTIPTEQRNNKWITTYNNADFPFLLGNMGGKEQESDLLNMSMYEKVYLTITTTNDEIAEALENWIDMFFAQYNFGQRSSKGFGSFSVIQIDGKNIIWNESDVIPSETRYMSFSINDNNSLSFQYKLFSALDFYWKCLKSGINYTRNGQYPGRYIKAFLWHYFNSETANNPHPTWEKRFIKQSFNLTTDRDVQENNNTPTFARAVLGCPDKFEYKIPNRTVTVEIKHSLPKEDANFIARIPSPIILKPILFDRGRVKVYILIDNETVDRLYEMPNKIFNFSVGLESRQLFLPQRINYSDLIRRYHAYLTSDQDVLDAMYSTTDRQQYLDADDGLENRNNWFVPLNFNWRNILGGNSVIKFYILR